MKKIVLALVFLSVLPITILAKDINFDLTVDRNKVVLGSSLQLNLTFNDTQSIPAVNLPEIDGFRVRYLGPSSMMSVVNGKVTNSITHIYTLLSAKIGTFKIGPFVFEHNKDKYTSNQISVQVVNDQDQGVVQGQPDNTSTDSLGLEDKVFLIIKPEKNKMYLNELVPLNIKLYVNKLALRDIQMPEISHDGFSLGEFEQPKQYQEILVGVNYEVIDFNTTIFGLRPGEFKLGPANLKCNLIVKKDARRRQSPGFDDLFDSNIFDDFFGRYEIYPLNLKSADLVITILALPQDNIPQNFSGALGDFDMDVNVSPVELKVGDPITIRTMVRGEGNWSTVIVPKLKTEADFKVYEPEIKQENNQKSFEQIVMPLETSIKEIPEISFNFFNTRTGNYQTITKGPFPIKVNKPDKEEVSKIIGSGQVTSAIAKEEKLGRDIIYIKDSIGKLKKKGEYFYKNTIFLLLQMIPVLIFILSYFYYVRSNKLKNDTRYARQLVAPKKARAGLKKAKGCLALDHKKEFFDAVFLTLQDYLGDKFHLSSQSITSSIINEVLRQKSIEESILIKLNDIFRDCDMARYAVSELNKESMENTLRKLEEIIDYLQRNKI